MLAPCQTDDVIMPIVYGHTISHRLVINAYMIVRFHRLDGSLLETWLCTSAGRNVRIVVICVDGYPPLLPCWKVHSRLQTVHVHFVGEREADVCCSRINCTSSFVLLGRTLRDIGRRTGQYTQYRTCTTRVIIVVFNSQQTAILSTSRVHNQADRQGSGVCRSSLRIDGMACWCPRRQYTNTCVHTYYDDDDFHLFFFVIINLS